MNKNGDKSKKTGDNPNQNSSYRCGYTVEAFKNAIDEVKSGKMTIRASAQFFKVPRSTLCRALKSGTEYKRKLGAPTTLGKEIEARIVRCVLNLANAGLYNI